MVKKAIKNKIKRYADLLEKTGIPIQQIILFGSHARGEAAKDSDIDLCVVSKKLGVNRLDEISLLLKLAQKIDPRIEAIPVSPKMWRSDKISPILHEVRQKGIKVV